MEKIDQVRHRVRVLSYIMYSRVYLGCVTDKYPALRVQSGISAYRTICMGLYSAAGSSGMFGGLLVGTLSPTALTTMGDIKSDITYPIIAVGRRSLSQDPRNMGIRGGITSGGI